jgi:hypothetical protein
MFLNTMLLDAPTQTTEYEYNTVIRQHLICGTTGLPTGHYSDTCHPYPAYTNRILNMVFNEYDEQATDYATETGYVIAPDAKLDQTPVHNTEVEINQPSDDVLTWNGDIEGRMLQSSAKLEDRFHVETMQNLKTSCEEIEKFLASRLGSKICKDCKIANPVVATSCIYCN